MFRSMNFLFGSSTAERNRCNPSRQQRHANGSRPVDQTVIDMKVKRMHLGLPRRAKGAADLRAIIAKAVEIETRERGEG